MGIHQVRNARGESLYQGRPKSPMMKANDQDTDVHGGANPTEDEMKPDAPTKSRNAFKDYSTTSPPKGDQTFTGVEGPTRGMEESAEETGETDG